MSDKDNDPWFAIARYSGVAVLLPASTLAGYGMGYGLDYLFGTHFLRIVFLVLGTVAGFVQMIRELTKE